MPFQDTEQDIQLPSAEDENGVLDGETVLELVKDCVDGHTQRSLRFLAQAELNERTCQGDQFLQIGADYTVSGITDWPSWISKTARNLVRNLRLTWSSRVVEDRPWVQCYPSEPGMDQMASQVAQKILENCRQRQDFDAMSFDGAELVQPHSAVAFKIVWDPLIGPPSKGFPQTDEMGNPILDETGQPVMEGVGQPTGDVVWELITVFDYGTDGNENIEDSEWFYVSKYVDKYTARAMLRSAGIDPSEVDVKEYDDVWGIKQKGVEVTELWWRPGFRFPKGLYAVTVGAWAVQAIPFPYKHGELPIAVWKCGSRRNSSFGSSHVDDAVPIQQAINEDVAALQQQVRLIGGVKFLAHSSITKKWQNGNQMIDVDDPELAKNARFLEPAPRSEVLVASLEDNVQALYTVWGLNEVLSGAENVKSGTSAKSIAYLNKLDSMKMAGASRSLNKAVVRVARQTLKLYQQYVKVPRLAEIAGEASMMGAMTFVGSDLAGVDVKLESASGTTQMRGQTAGDAQDQINAGNPNPALAEQAQTGLKDTSFARASRDVVRAQAEAAMNGEPQQVDNETDPIVAAQELMSIMSKLTQHPPALLQLYQQYQEKAAAMAAPPEAAAGAPAPPKAPAQ